MCGWPGPAGIPLFMMPPAEQMLRKTAAVTQTSAAVCGEEKGVEIAVSAVPGGIDIDELDVRPWYRVRSRRR